MNSPLDHSRHSYHVLMTANLQHLRYVVLAAESGSFRRVGRMVGRNSSQVSRKIVELEDHLGGSLFERGAFGVRPTLAGRQFIVSITAALDQIDEAMALSGAAGRGEAGILRLGIILTIAQGPLRRLIEVYTERHPEIDLALVDGSRSSHLSSIRTHALDIAFLPGSAA